MSIRSLFLKLGIPVIAAGMLIFFASSVPLQKLRDWAFVLVRPVISLNLGTSRALLSFAGGISRDDAAVLFNENEKLKASLFEEEKLRDEVTRLRRAFSFGEEHKLTLLGSRVLLYQRDLGKEYLIVDRGGKNGVVLGSVALDEHGALVGTVAEVNDNFSKIDVASNPGRNYESEFIPAGSRVLAKGIGGRAFSIDLVPHDTPVRRGDFVVSFPSVGARNPVLLAEVTGDNSLERLPFKEVRAVLLSRPELLSEVFIIGQ